MCCHPRAILVAMKCMKPGMTRPTALDVMFTMRLAAPFHGPREHLAGEEVESTLTADIERHAALDMALNGWLR